MKKFMMKINGTSFGKVNGKFLTISNSFFKFSPSLGEYQRAKPY
jgi:hypothetical protein